MPQGRHFMSKHSLQATASLVAEMGKAFDVLAEGLVSEKSRGDRTPLELFIAGVRGCEGHLRRLLDDGRSYPV